MKITSPAFENNQKIPSVNSCDGKGVNPPLVFEDVPENAKSLALIVEDPDAPGGTFIHWVVFNIDPKVRKIDEGSVPSGAVEGVTSSGIGFVPPCPPSGTHRYIFKLFALDNTLNLQKGASKEEVEQAMQGHTIEQTELIGLYGRG
ncbi:YbhB/YbcL family Raf kinase inhibitor-like protein [Candidatus Microgenomates bacterium]|nr:MAG: YbhB/YbcL family Raf kinase inhibitor-like protein [Candidatus Microgenomates bacterium]